MPVIIDGQSIFTAVHNPSVMFEILAKIARRKVPEDYGLPIIGDAEPVPLSIDNFHKIEGGGDGKKLCFVDGGNNRIVLYPGGAVDVVRLYYSVFRSAEKIEFGRYDFVLDSRYDADDKSYIVEIYDLSSSNLLPNRMRIEENYVKEGAKEIGSFVRRIGEWLLVEKIADKCHYVVRDGSLQTGERGEGEYQERALKSASGIIGISKTCSLITTRGYSLVAAIHHLSMKHGIKAPWYYNPVAKNISTIKGDLFVIKLHPFSDYAFRSEIYPEDASFDILSELVSMSSDPTFLGYPYGLIDADLNARVSDEEIKIYRSLFSDNLDEFSRLEMNAMNAHDIISGVK